MNDREDVYSLFGEPSKKPSRSSIPSEDLYAIDFSNEQRVEPASISPEKATPRDVAPLIARRVLQSTVVVPNGDDIPGLEFVQRSSLWPEEMSEKRDADVGVAAVLAVLMETSAKSSVFYTKQIDDAIDTLNMALSQDEYAELIAAFVYHENVNVRDDGGFTLRHLETVPGITSPRPIRPRDVSRVMQKINKSEAVRQAADLAKNRADNRVRGRTYKGRGGGVHKSRNQGKKKTFEQLLEEARRSGPKES